MADMEKQQSYFKELMEWFLSRLTQLSNTFFNDLPAYVRHMWEETLRAMYLQLTPGENFGREAMYIFLVGTVPAFLVGSTSAALLFGIAPGFIAGIGLMVAFSQCQKNRSKARRIKVFYKPTLITLVVA